MGSYLNDSHGQSRFFGKLFSDVPGGLRRLRESRLQDLQLLGFDCRPWTSAFAPGPLAPVGVVLGVVVAF